jgi:hypothetical protein
VLRRDKGMEMRREGNKDMFNGGTDGKGRKM